MPSTLTPDEAERLAEEDSCADLVGWTASCCLRSDGTPLGTRALDLSARMLFWMAGMTTGSPASFRRKVWDTLTWPQLSVAKRNDRGVHSVDITAPGLEGDPDVPLRRYDLAQPLSQQPLGARHGDPQLDVEDDQPVREAVLVVFHGGGFCIQSEKDAVYNDLVIDLLHRCRKTLLHGGSQGGASSSASSPSSPPPSSPVRKFDRVSAYSCGYRLAPEHPFPAGLRDAAACLLHVQRSHPGCELVLLGDSAGGNLALVLALVAGAPHAGGDDQVLVPDPKAMAMAQAALATEAAAISALPRPPGGSLVRSPVRTATTSTTRGSSIDGPGAAWSSPGLFASPAARAAAAAPSPYAYRQGSPAGFTPDGALWGKAVHAELSLKVQPRLRHLGLLYPALYATETASMRATGIRYLVPRKLRIFFLLSYLGDDEMVLTGRLLDYRVAPLKASNALLAKLPSATVVSCGLDPLRDENLMLVSALRQLGVPCSHAHAEKAPHGFLTFPPLATDHAAKAHALDVLVAAMATALGATATDPGP